MSEPVYGDRRCPECQSVKPDAYGPCWYCNRKKPLSPDEEEAVATMAKTIATEVDENLLKETLVDLGLTGQKIKIVTDPLMDPGTFEFRPPAGPFMSGKVEAKLALELIDEPVTAIESKSLGLGWGTTDFPVLEEPSRVAEENLAATQKLFGGPIPVGMASLDQMKAVMLRVRAWRSYDIHGDAVQLARWLQGALDEYAKLFAIVNEPTKHRPDE